MKKIILTALMVISTSAMAEISYSMPALEVGFKWNSMDGLGAISNKQSMGIQVGGSTVLNINSEFGVRTGLFYSERPFKGELSSGPYEGKISYAEVPVHFMFKLEDFAGIYIGPSLAMKLGDEITCAPGPCNLTDIKPMILPITFGAQFKFTPNLGLNLFFETVPSDLALGLKNSRGIGMNLLVAFE